MLDFSFIAPTVLSLCPSLSFSLSLYLSLSPSSQVGGLVRPHCFHARHVSFNLPPLGVRHWPWCGGLQVKLACNWCCLFICFALSLLSLSQHPHAPGDYTHCTHSTSGHVQTPPLDFFFSCTHTQTHMWMLKTTLINLNNSLMLECSSSYKVPPLTHCKYYVI